MPVLKRHQNTPAMRDAIVLDLGDIGAQAARIRASAETQAQQIIANAQAKAEQAAQSRGDEAEKLGYADGLEQGIKQGREQGRAEALAQASEQLQQLMAAWSQVVTDWEQQRTEMEREARQAVLEFALTAAEKIVHRVIEVDESVVVDQAAQALSLVLSNHDANLHIHPVDRPMLEDALPELLQELVSVEHIELIEDEQITPGGCVVSFGQGRIDATIEKQMERLINLILPEPPAIEDDEPAELDPPQPAAQAATLPPPPQDAAMDAATTLSQQGLIAPVYEITEQGLVESSPLAPGKTPGAPADAMPGTPMGTAPMEDQAEIEPEQDDESEA